MPLYEFDLIDPSGQTVASLALPLPVADRDALTLRRRTVPATVGISGAAADPGQAGRQVLRAYQRLEQKHGNTREFRRRIGHSPAAVQRAWSH